VPHPTPPTEKPTELLGNPVFLSRDPDDGWVFAEPAEIGIETRDSITACIRAMCPLHLPDFEDDRASAVAEVLDQVRRHLVYMHPTARFGLKAAFILADWSPLLLLKSTRRLRDMGPDEAARSFATTLHSPVHAIARLAAGVRAAVVMAFYDLPVVHQRLDYDPVGHMRERTDLRRRLLAGEAAAPGDMLRPSEAQLIAAAERAQS